MPEYVSSCARDLLKAMVNVDVNQRLSAKQVLEQVWFQDTVEKKKEVIPASLIESLQSFSCTNASTNVKIHKLFSSKEKETL